MTHLSLLLSVLLTPVQQSRAIQDSAARTLEQRLDRFVRPYAASNNFTGVILVRRGGRVQLEKGYGMANYELGVPNSGFSRFQIASVTKAFTAAAILLLEERGKLSLSDSVSRHLPGYPNGDRIRIEHLLRHTAGIPNLGSGPDWARQERLPHTTEQLVSLFKDLPLEFEPGTQTRYSNSNYNLLTLILEKVSGQSYERFLRDNIWTPLGLRSTLDGSDMTRLVPNRATGVEPDGVRDVRPPRLIDWSSRKGSGSLVSTTADLDRFLEGLFRGKLLQPASVEKILAPAEGFAFGWTRGERSGRKLMRSAGRSPGYTSSVERYLDDGTTVILLSNSYSPVAQDSVFLAGVHAVVSGKAPDPPALLPVPVRRGSLEQLAGHFQMPADYFVPDARLELIDRDDRLEAVWANGARNTIYPVGPNRFLDRNFWATVSFIRDSGGNVSGFTYEVGGQRFRAERRNEGTTER
ncbi:MAG TPA: serine hydrolase domain-containing protein [Gemmatimonadales bacterium]|nr:serine hydrolase domain-containing protein [Gemmatimonadales bacterium]